MADTYIRFKAPVTYPDTLVLGARVFALTESDLQMEYIMVSTKNQAVAAESSCRIVIYDYHKNAKGVMPKNIYQAILDFEQVQDASQLKPALKSTQKLLQSY